MPIEIKIEPAKQPAEFPQVVPPPKREPVEPKPEKKR